MCSSFLFWFKTFGFYCFVHLQTNFKNNNLSLKKKSKQDISSGKRIIEEWGNRFLPQKANNHQQPTLNSWSMCQLQILDEKFLGFNRKKQRSDWSLIWSHWLLLQVSCVEISYLCYLPFMLRWGEKGSKDCQNLNYAYLSSIILCVLVTITSANSGSSFKMKF